jgi:hypothetical protein
MFRPVSEVSLSRLTIKKVRPLNKIILASASKPLRSHWVRVLTTLVAATALGSGAQSGPQVPSQSHETPILLPDTNTQTPKPELQIPQQDSKAVDAGRKTQIATDSASLLNMALNLKAEVDKTTKDTLSLRVIRDADAIEKLAHSVKAR